MLNFLLDLIGEFQNRIFNEIRSPLTRGNLSNQFEENQNKLETIISDTFVINYVLSHTRTKTTCDR